jgi:hypothetical protein
MKESNNKKIIYSLNIDDIQNVAQQDLERELTPAEIQLVIEKIKAKMPWFDIISDSISEVLNVKELHQ